MKNTPRFSIAMSYNIRSNSIGVKEYKQYLRSKCVCVPRINTRRAVGRRPLLYTIYVFTWEGGEKSAPYKL